jgi:REP element-mobilizing transposase RayT
LQPLILKRIADTIRDNRATSVLTHLIQGLTRVQWFVTAGFKIIADKIPARRSGGHDTHPHFRNFPYIAQSNQILMEKKEYYKHLLPHFQQPGQAYFITWILKDAIPPHALKRYTEKLERLKAEVESFDKGAEVSNLRKIADKIPARRSGGHDTHATPNPELEALLKEYYSMRKKYIKAYDDLLAVQECGLVNLTKQELLQVISEALLFWEGKRIENIAFCVMSNHVHWVFRLKEADENGKPVYLQDIMHSVKRHTANQINKLTGEKGALWQKESFDTTIRDMEHEYNAVRYTLNNPVEAKLAQNWKVWPGSWCCKEYENVGF